MACTLGSVFATQVDADRLSPVNRSIPMSSIVRSHALLENPCASTAFTVPFSITTYRPITFTIAVQKSAQPGVAK